MFGMKISTINRSNVASSSAARPLGSAVRDRYSETTPLEPEAYREAGMKIVECDA
jgi:hypothetical protein